MRRLSTNWPSSEVSVSSCALSLVTVITSADAILDVHLHRASNLLLESLLLDGDRVTADPERAGDILSRTIGGESQLNATIDVGHGDLGVRDHRAARVAYQADNGSGIFLRP